MSLTSVLLGPLRLWHRSSWPRRLFLLLLLGVATLYGGLVSWHLRTPLNAGQSAFLERCRQVCLRYGLVPSGNVSRDAREYLQAVGAQSTASRAARWRLDPAFAPVPSQPHPLLGQPAPEFELPDSQKRPRSLAATRALGPVVLVFYYGFQCSHCVAQLYQVDYDFGEFDKLGVQVLALCADSPEHSNRQMSRHGRFGFPLLSDADNRVASLYGVFTPATGERDEDLQHGTFVIDRDGRVVWAQRGYEPFTDNATLLKVIAGLEAPAPQTE